MLPYECLRVYLNVLSGANLDTNSHERTIMRLAINGGIRARISPLLMPFGTKPECMTPLKPIITNFGQNTIFASQTCFWLFLVLRSRVLARLVKIGA